VAFAGPPFADPPWIGHVQEVAMPAVGSFSFLRRLSGVKLWAPVRMATAAAVAAGPALAQSPETPGGSAVAAASGVQQGLTLLFGLLLVALLLVLGRIGLRMLGRGVRALARPVGRGVRTVGKPVLRLLRILRLIPKEPRRLAVPAIGTITTGTIGSAFAGSSETEEAISRGVDKSELDGMIFRNSQLLCTWLAPMPAPRVAYDTSAAEADRDKVRHFFSAAVPVYFNPFNLYEDADGAFIVGLFGASDRRVFHVLSEFRKTINRNVLWLAILLSMVASFVALANIFMSAQIPFHRVLGMEGSPYLPADLFGAGTNQVFDKFVFGALSCLVAYAVIWLFYRTEYAVFQRNNGQQMSNFLQHYMDGINVSFTSISRNLSDTVAQEREAPEMKHDAALWMSSLQWMAFRVFFIEHYLRNMLFQIHRNSTYFVVFVPLAFFAAIVGMAAYSGVGQLNVLSLQAELYHQNSFYVCFVLLLLACYRHLRDALSFVWLSIFPKFDEATGDRASSWTKFRDLNLQGSITRTLDAYIDSLDRWRSMMKSRG
jgi:hypothetical protein